MDQDPFEASAVKLLTKRHPKGQMDLQKASAALTSHQEL